MRDKRTFQPEPFPLEILTGEFEESDTEFEGEFEEELEEERGGGRFRQGRSARRGGPSRAARARRRPQRPGRPGRPGYPPRRSRWPYVAWPVGAVPTTDTTADASGPESACPCAANAQPASADAAPPDTGAPDAGAPVDAGGVEGGGDQELFGNVADRIGSGIGNIFGGAVAALDTANIIDLTATADRTKRKGTRDPKTVYALVLHQMACCFAPQNPLKRFLTVGAHFAIASDGRILRLHPVSALLWASNGFNNRSVAVEFAGNFPDTRGRWWQGSKYGMNRPTPAQVTAGRQLIRYLIRTMGLTHVLAHRQSSGTRENDPGPDIWFDVGQWAVNTLGLKDGGSGFKIDTGNPIPEEWRTWGSRRPAVTPEIRFEQDTSMPETEIVHDEWDREQPDAGKELIMHNRHCGCRRCASAGSFEARSLEYESGGGFGEMESEMSDEQEMDLALELLTVSSEAELDQFLGKLIKGAWKGIKKVAKPLGGVLRKVAKAALPMVGGALGSFIPIPGVGTAVGSALGGAIGKALEMETEGLSVEDRELEVARRFVRIATSAARQVAAAPSYMDEETAANQAVAAAARKYLPTFQFKTAAAGAGTTGGAQQGRWIRRGSQVVLLGA